MHTRSDYLAHNGPCPLLVVKHDEARVSEPGGPIESAATHDGILLPRLDEACEGGEGVGSQEEEKKEA